MLLSVIMWAGENCSDIILCTRSNGGVKMASKMTEEEIYEEAKKRVKEKKDLYVHIVVYICVNAFLVVTWAVTSGGFPWFVFPLCGWGIGLLFHVFDVLVWRRKSDSKAIEKEAERLRKE